MPYKTKKRKRGSSKTIHRSKAWTVRKSRRKRSYRGKVSRGKKGRKYTNYGNSRKGITPQKLNKLLAYTCVPSIIPALGRGCGFDPVKMVRHDVAGIASYTGAGVLGGQLMGSVAINSPHDPFDTFGSIQPEGYDLLSTIYERYVVTGAQVRYSIKDCNDPTVSESNRVWSWPQYGRSSAPANDTWGLASQNEDPMIYINANNVSNSLGGKAKEKSRTLACKYIQPKLYIASDVGVNYGAVGTGATGANPNTKVFVKLYGGFDNNYDIGFGQALEIDIKITMYVTYYGLKTSVRDS